jgi:hypothetical protein
MPTLHILSALSVLMLTPTLLLLAFFTTALASATLLARVVLIYIELGVALLRHWRSRGGDDVISANSRQRSEARQRALTVRTSTRAITAGVRSRRNGSMSAVELRDYEMRRWL